MGSALNTIDAAITAPPALDRNVKQLGAYGGMIPSKLGQKYESENVTVVWIMAFLCSSIAYSAYNLIGQA